MLEYSMFFYRYCRFLLLLPLVVLTGCGSNLDDYRGQGPSWDLARF
ncbi:MAG: hypothetical protein RIQ83_3428, partial [Pseudomonadota bacterium]